VSLRLFVAIEPHAPVRERLVALQDELRRRAGRGAGDLKWVAADNLHLTLQFLGAVAEAAVDAVRRAVVDAAATAAPLSLTVNGAGAFPSPRRPRVLWAGLEGDVDAARALVRDLGERLGPLGFPPEARPWAAHVTLARARDPRGAPRLARLLDGLPAPPATTWRADDVVLFRSHLSPAGPRYEALLRAPLGGP
jgi:2'-5' RNA ligase